MKAETLANFRSMQLALKGASLNKYEAKVLLLEGIDCITIGDNILIKEILLDKDCVTAFMFGDIPSYMPLSVLSEEIIVEIIDTMRCKALELADRCVMININGEIVK